MFPLSSYPSIHASVVQRGRRMQDTILIMLKTATKNLFTKSACKMYPVQKPIFFERTRGRIEFESSKCRLDMVCEKRCPTGAIVVDREKLTWQIDRFKCIVCGNCIEGCKPNALRMVNHYAGPVVKKQIESHRVPPPKMRRKKADSLPGSAEE
jgi:ech hydrogenase subunit F